VHSTSGCRARRDLNPWISARRCSAFGVAGSDRGQRSGLPHGYLLGLCCIVRMQTAGPIHDAMTDKTASSLTSPLRLHDE
jgi:hypothetical protein